MRAAIALASVTPPALAATCWWSCECTLVCPAAWGAAVCIGIALAAGAVIFAAASLAWALHELSKHRPPIHHAQGWIEPPIRKPPPKPI